MPLPSAFISALLASFFLHALAFSAGGKPLEAGHLPPDRDASNNLLPSGTALTNLLNEPASNTENTPPSENRKRKRSQDDEEGIQSRTDTKKTRTTATQTIDTDESVRPTSRTPAYQILLDILDDYERLANRLWDSLGLNEWFMVLHRMSAPPSEEVRPLQERSSSGNDQEESSFRRNISDTAPTPFEFEALLDVFNDIDLYALLNDNPCIDLDEYAHRIIALDNQFLEFNLVLFLNNPVVQPHFHLHLVSASDHDFFNQLSTDQYLYFLISAANSRVDFSVRRSNQHTLGVTNLRSNLYEEIPQDSLYSYLSEKFGSNNVYLAIRHNPQTDINN